MGDSTSNDSTNNINEIYDNLSYNDNVSDEDNDLIIPVNFFEEEEYLDRYRTFQITTFDDVIDAIDDYVDIYKYDKILTMFKICVSFRINGQIRTKLFNRVTIKEFYKLFNQYQIVIEKYDNDNDIEYLFERFINVKIRPVNPWFGKGDNYYITEIYNNLFYQICFTKTSNTCLATSAIKHEEPLNRDKTATEFTDHPLMKIIRYVQITNIYQSQSIIENYYNKKVKIFYSIEEINPNEINLFSRHNHIGYITNDYPVLDIFLNHHNRLMVKQELKDIYALVSLDCEFSWSPIADRPGELINNEPNLIVMTILLKEGRKQIVKKSFKQILNYLINMANLGQVFVYSVNGAKVEHQFIAKELVKSFSKNQDMYEFGNVNGTSLKVLHYGSNLTFLDTVFLMNMSVSDMVKSFGTTCEKGHKEWDIYPKTKKVWINDKWEYVFDKSQWYKNKKWDTNNKHDVEYCANDTIIALEALLKFNKIITPLVNCLKYKLPNGDIWSLANSSISSIGKQTILSHFPNGNNCMKAKGLFQPQYLGGRCEIYKHGYIKSSNLRTIMSIDINSAYTGNGSLELPYEFVKQSPILNENTNYKWGMFCYIRYLNNYKVPPLGLIRNNEFIFPNIENSTLMFIWDFEFKKLQHNISIDKIEQVYYFTSVSYKDIFQPWYEMKKNASTTSERVAAKMLCNGSLGGLGLKQIQDGRALTLDPERHCSEHNIYTAEFYDAFDNYKWLIYDKFIISKTSYHTIGYITALTRMQLWNKYRSCLKIDPSAELIRWDTDGLTIIGNNELKEHLRNTSNKELEGWDFETHEAGYMRGLKKYCLDDKIKFNGINRSNLSHMSMMRLLDETVTTVNEKWSRTKNCNITLQTDRIINMNKEYTKGIIMENGDIVPLVI